MKKVGSISRKIGFYIAFLSVAFTIVIAGLIAAGRISSTNYTSRLETTGAINDRLFGLVNSSAEVQSVIQRLLRLKDFDSLEVLIGKFDTLAITADSALRQAGADSSEVRPALDSLIATNRQVLDKLLQNNAAGANLYYISMSNPAYENLRMAIDRFRKVTEQKTLEATIRIRQESERFLLAAAILALLTIITGIIWGIFFQRSISTPLARLIAMLKDIVEGNGDLTKRVSVASNDELGTMADLFNRFIEQQQTIISSIANNAGILASSANEITSITNTIAAQSATLTQQSASVSTSASETSSGITTISASVEEMSSSISTIATAAEEISATLNEVSRNCQKESSGAADAANLAKANRDLMHRLGETTTQIDSILETIDDIAEQTNMLALNATIEAASAGEAGRSFAVVAAEVKSLARLTAQSTIQIAQQIEQIKRSVAESIAESEKILTVIEEVSTVSCSIASAVEEQSATINEVAKNIAEASAASGSISRTVSTGATHLTKIASNIQTMDGALSENRLQIKTVQENASALADLSTQLDAIVKKFKLK